MRKLTFYLALLGLMIYGVQVYPQSSKMLLLMDDDITKPNQIDGLVGWYAQTYIKDTGTDSVNTWVDEAVIQNAIQNYAQDRRPRLIGNGLNGKSTLALDGINDFLKLPVFTYTRFTIFVVMNATATNNIKSIVARNYDAVGMYSRVVPSNDGTNPGKISFRVNTTTIYSLASVTDSWKTATFMCDSLLSPVLLFVNGVQQDSGSAATPSYGAGDIFAIGAGTRTLGNGFLYSFQGQIAEVIIYNRYLIPAERIKIEKYLNDKWRIY